jgi:hypothetical protein
MHGHLDVPSFGNDEEDTKLRSWIDNQRLNYRKFKQGTDMKGSFTEEHIQRLQGLELVLEIPEMQRARKPSKRWELMLERLKQHYETTTSFELYTKEEEELKNWVLEQKVQYRYMKEGKQSTMSNEKVRRLSAIGYEFEYVSFQERLAQLKEYIQTHGTRLIPKYHELSTWSRKIKIQLERFEEGKVNSRLTQEQADELKELGFFTGNVREPVDTEEENRKWEASFEEMRQYKEEHGNCLINSNLQSELVRWMMAQRRHYHRLKEGKTSKLTASQLSRLHDIGFVFRQKPKYKSFEDRLEEYKAYKEEHGVVPTTTLAGGLGSFVSTCRNEHFKFTEGQKSTLTAEKVQTLTDLGFVWQVGKRRMNQGPCKPWEGKIYLLLEKLLVDFLSSISLLTII